jgi:protoporphyrinogen/coproporphyrinogen III oxidase
MPGDAPKRVAIVGGGITGLAAAHRLATNRSSGAPIEQVLFEAGDRLGGVIYSDRIDGCVVEAGPDSFLTEKPQAFDLARELDIAGDVIGSNDNERLTYILHRHRLVPLPDGLMFLVPTRLLPMAFTPLIPLADKIGMLRELFLRPRKVDEESVAGFVERHFGRGMVDNIADPLLSGVYGGDADQLSVRSTLPRFADMEEKRGSLIRAVLAARKKMRHTTVIPRSLFSTMRSGLSQFVVALEARLPAGSVSLQTSVTELRPSPWPAGGDGYELLSDGRELGRFGAVILALPAHHSARLLAGVDARLADPLAEIPYSSSMTVVLGYPPHIREQLPPGFGFLVPHNEGLRTRACTFVHAKFPQRVPEDLALLRCFLGGTRDPQVLDLSDAEITALVRQELSAILALEEEPRFVRIYRWRGAMAQYAVGHRDRVTAVKQALADYPGLYVAGNWESGIGISDCIRTGQTAATNAVRFLLS